MRTLLLSGVTLALTGGLHLGCSNDEPTPDGNGGQGGQGQGGGSNVDPCIDAEELPELIDEDTTVSGCVILDETVVDGEAELTIEAGTTILVRAGGYLSISRFSAASENGATLTAQGAAEKPIVFTSIEDDPRPGDWGCVFLGADAEASEMEHMVLEYGGAPCGAVGTGPESALVVSAPVRTVREVTARSSAGHGMIVEQDATVQVFESNHFSDNELPSLALDANQLVSLGEGSTFADENDYIEVSSSGMNRDGTIVAQEVPYRFVAGATVGTAGAQPEITVSAGTRFELSGASFIVQAGNLLIEGDADDPVVFTSSADSPAAGDWGCLWFQHHALGTQATGVPTVENAVIEFAGDDSCGNNNDWNTAMVVTEDAILDGLTFNDIAGHAILAPLEPCPAGACTHEFNDLAADPLSCDGMPTTCP